MFLVQISAPEQDEKGLTARMNTMREWLDHCRFEPSVFRYSSDASGAVFNVEFKVEAEALAFAKEFGGANCALIRCKGGGGLRANDTAGDIQPDWYAARKARRSPARASREYRLRDHQYERYPIKAPRTCMLVSGICRENG